MEKSGNRSATVASVAGADRLDHAGRVVQRPDVLGRGWSSVVRRARMARPVSVATGG